MHSNAANLAPFLIHLQENYPQHYHLVVETVRMVAPFFGDFVLAEVADGQTQLRWRDRYSELVYNPSQLSDGTLRFICLAALLLQPNPPATIIIDEPELGLHPAAVQILVSLLYGAAERTQLIVSTQSSLLVDELEPEEIIVANTHEGETILERLDGHQLETWLEEYTIGQLWEKNVLGGLP
ncbi:MAG: AAA family ATPase [Chloroflexi bacterium]|nr:AAA family ATPase [Chloroflexota bacterium]